MPRIFLHLIFEVKEILMEKNIKLNHWAVIATGITAFLLSILWYSPLLFGEIWEQYRHAPNSAIPEWTMAFAPLREIIASYVLAKLIVLLKLKGWKKQQGCSCCCGLHFML